MLPSFVKNVDRATKNELQFFSRSPFDENTSSFQQQISSKNFKWVFHNYTRLLEEGLATFFLNGQKSVLQERMSKK